MHAISRSHSWNIVGGLVLILIGMLFLLGNVVGVQTWELAGPLMMLLFGGIFFVGMFMGGRHTGALAIPGSMFVILGLLMTADALFDLGPGWASAWALFAPAGVGVGLLVYSGWSVKPELKRAGYILILIGLAIFLGFGLLLGTFFGASMTTTVWLALGLIGLGTLLMVGRVVQWGNVLDRLPPRFDTNQPAVQDETKALEVKR